MMRCMFPRVVTCVGGTVLEAATWHDCRLLNTLVLTTTHVSSHLQLSISTLLHKNIEEEQRDEIPADDQMNVIGEKLLCLSV